MKNNFNKSRTGQNIECTVTYDSDLASIYYQAFLEDTNRIALSRDSYVYLLGDASKPYYTKEELNKMKHADLLQLVKTYELVSLEKKFTRAEVIQALLTVTIVYHYETQAEQLYWHEFGGAVCKEGKHAVHFSRGYSQNDTKLIIHLNNDENMTYTNEAIDNIFWDMPVYVQVYADDEPLIDDTYHFFKDEYSYDKDLLMVYLREHHAATLLPSSLEWLGENLPSEPSYN